MEYNPHEVDQIDVTICPYDNNHQFEKNLNGFYEHIKKCKDEFNPHVSSRVKICPFSENHIFKNETLFNYHVPRCPMHTSRTEYYNNQSGIQSNKIDYLICAFNSNHWITPEAFDQHIKTCPHRRNKQDNIRGIKEIQQRAQHTTPKVSRNRCNGILSPQVLSESKPTQRVCLSTESNSFNTSYKAARCIILHYAGSSFSVLKAEVFGRSLPEHELYIERLTYANYEEWPGLRQIEEERNYQDYMVATLHKDTEDFGSSSLYDKILEYMNKRLVKTFRIGTCSQDAGSDDRIYFIVHKDEPGFGNHIYNADLGVFCFRHSVLYGRQSRFIEIQMHLEQTQENLRSVREELRQTLPITNDLEAAKRRIAELLEEKRKLKEEYLASFEQVQSDFKDRITNSKKCMLEAAQFYEQNIKKLQENYDCKQNENYKKIKELESQLIDSRNQQEIGLQDELSKLNDLQESYDREKQRNSGLQKQLHEKIEQNNNLAEELTAYKNRLNHLTNAEELEQIMHKKESEIRSRLIEDMRDGQMCRMCLQNKKNTVFIPCGHLLYCNVCANGLGIELKKNLVRSKKYHHCECCGAIVEKVIQAFAYC